MTKSLISELEKYKNRIKFLDEKAEKLTNEKKIQYSRARADFINRLEAWKNSVESDIASLRRNIEEGYHELESKLM